MLDWLCEKLGDELGPMVAAVLFVGCLAAVIFTVVWFGLGRPEEIRCRRAYAPTITAHDTLYVARLTHCQIPEAR